jgi:hypothetical protein
MAADLEISMLRDLQLARRLTYRTAFAAIVMLACARANAQVKPLIITGGGTAPDGISLIPLTPAPHPTTGNATELGRYTGLGFFQILNFTGPLTAQFSSAPDVTFVAANGDKLVMTYGVVANGAARPGQVTLTPNADGSFSAVFVAEFNPVLAKCTGRFASVTSGSLIMIAMSSPFFIVGTNTTPFTYVWQGEGQLVYGNAAGARKRARQPDPSKVNLNLLRAQLQRTTALRQVRPAARTR